MITSISDLRSKPSAWPNIWNEVLTMYSTHDITIEGPQSPAGKCKRIRAASDYYYINTVGHRVEVVAIENFRLQVFIPVVYRILSKLKRVFALLG